eukprot:1573438-Pleurochrysis_carterae.AAC.2
MLSALVLRACVAASNRWGCTDMHSVTCTGSKEAGASPARFDEAGVSSFMLTVGAAILIELLAEAFVTAGRFLAEATAAAASLWSNAQQENEMEKGGLLKLFDLRRHAHRSCRGESVAIGDELASLFD